MYAEIAIEKCLFIQFTYINTKTKRTTINIKKIRTILLYRDKKIEKSMAME